MNTALIHIVLPTLAIDEAFMMTLRSLDSLGSMLGEVVVIHPNGIDHSSADKIVPNIRFILERGRGVYACFNQSVGEIQHNDGYVLFIGVGDRVLGGGTQLAEALAQRPGVIAAGIIRPDGTSHALRQPEYLLRQNAWLLGRLPHHQSMLYRLDIARGIPFPMQYKIYGDVIQRAKALRAAPWTSVDIPLVEAAAAGISSYNNLRRVWLHISERFMLAIPLVLMGEPLLAFRYVAGSGKVLAAALRNSYSSVEKIDQ